jgi:hypothetical protein
MLPEISGIRPVPGVTLSPFLALRQRLGCRMAHRR